MHLFELLRRPATVFFLFVLLPAMLSCKPQPAAPETASSVSDSASDPFFKGPKAGDVKDLEIHAHPPLIPKNIPGGSDPGTKFECIWDFKAGVRFTFYYNKKESVGGISGFFGSTKDVLTEGDGYRGDDVPSRMLRMDPDHLVRYLSKIKRPYGPVSTSQENTLRYRQAVVTDLQRRSPRVPFPTRRPLLVEAADGETLRIALDRSSVREFGGKNYLLMHLLVSKKGKVYASYRPEGPDMGKFAFNIDLGAVNKVGAFTLSGGAKLRFENRGGANMVLVEPQGFGYWTPGNKHRCSEFEKQESPDSIQDF